MALNKYIEASDSVTKIENTKVVMNEQVMHNMNEVDDNFKMYNREGNTAGENDIVDMNSNISDTTDILLKKIDDAWRMEEGFILGHTSETQSFLKSLNQVNISNIKRPEVVIGLLSSVSGGKSSFLNTAICQYPISPVANTTTSVCAVETRRANSLFDERIEVYLLSDTDGKFGKKPIVSFKKQQLNEVLFTALYDYADFLVNHSILNVKDSLAFFKDERGVITLERKNWRHCMLLLMIVLDAYVYQDKQNSEYLGSNYKEANLKRNELLSSLGIPINTDYGLRLYWHSDKIPENAVIVDLPGTGSATESTDGQVKHTDLVAEYLKQSSSVICFLDETATMAEETENLLGIFIAANKLKGESSARVTFVLNKADIIDASASDMDDADNCIITTINNFRQSFPISANYPVYAVSSWDGEWNFLNSNIPLENLHHATKFVAGLKKMYHVNPPAESVSNYQKERFERKYPYQLDIYSDFRRIDFSSFVEILFTDYVKRIQFLLAIEKFKEQMESVQTIAQLIQQEKNIFSIASDYSPKLAKLISNTILQTLDDELNVLIGEFQDLNTGMQKQLIVATTRIKQISEQFDADYAVLNNAINNKIQNKIASLEKQGDKIPIDGNILGNNEVGIRNRNKLIELSKDVAKLNFAGYFKKSFNKLDDEFSLERTLYEKSVNQMANLLNSFPNTMVNRMEHEFTVALQSEDLDDVQGFHSAFDIAKKSTYCLLNTVCSNYANSLLKDDTVEKVLQDTASRIQSDLLSLLTPYTNGDFGERIIDRISKYHLFKANTIEQAKLKSLLTQYYISEFKTKMDETLQDDIAGKNSTESAHTFRMAEAVTCVEKNHLSIAATAQLRNQVQNASNVADNVISDPKSLEDWKKALDKAAVDLQKFFGEDTAFGLFEEIFESHKTSSYSWAINSIKSVEETTRSIKALCEATIHSND